MTHAWCHDIARDAAVRAVEDGRDRPLPTLEEAIGMLPMVHEPKLASHANAGGEANHAAPAASGGGEVEE